MDILFYSVLFNPFRLVISNINNLSDAEIEDLYDSHIASQTPGVRRLQRTIRDPKDREVLIIAIDATDVQRESSSDSELNKSIFSGDRQKGFAVLYGTLATTNGTVLAIQPGPLFAAPPRSGDGVILGAQLGEADRAGHESGFTRFFLGTERRCGAACMDRGYVYRPNVRTGNDPTPLEWFQSHDVFLLYPSRNPGDQVLTYDRATDRLTVAQGVNFLCCSLQRILPPMKINRYLFIKCSSILSVIILFY